MNNLAALSIPSQIALYLGGFLVTTYLLMVLIHRAMPLELRRQHNEVVGFLIAVVAVFYGLIIASVLVIAINRFDHAEQVTENEAALVLDIVRHAKAVSPQIEGPVRKLAARYLDDVVAREWPAQMQGRTAGFALTALTDLAQAISGYEPRSQREGAYYSQLIQSLTKLYDARKERIFIADEGIAAAVWVVTLAGSVLTICFALLFGVENRRIHFVLVSFLAASLALIFALIAIFDRPFQGSMAVSNEPYRLVRQQVLQD